ncbi:hypothetical protein ACEQ8H_002638 [Pleosporales sp. CAS-2024a]
MCQYHYVYFDKCQHVSYYRVSYCNQAQELGQLALDSRSPSNGAGDAPSGAPAHSSSQPSAYSDNTSSPSHSQSQQDRHKMSTLTHSVANATLDHNPSVSQYCETSAPRSALIPRSALLDSDSDGVVGRPGLTSLSHASSLEHTHACSQSGRSVTSTTEGRAAAAGTLQAVPSTRKPLPSHWVSPGGGPKLATAQRAKERGGKPGLKAGSSTGKTMRSTRSMVDISQSLVTEGASFLTKTAHTPVENDLTNSAGGKSPTKHQSRSSRPAWNSPNGSPLRERASPRQQIPLSVRLSPTKTAFLSTEAVINNHKRATSSVATDTASSSRSFKSAAEILAGDGDQSPDLQLYADMETEQKTSLLKSPTKAGTVGRASKPKLKIKIPDLRTGGSTSKSSVESRASATSSSATSNSPWSSASVSSMSRIPRAAAPASGPSSAQGPTRSSTLKRTQSLKALTINMSTSPTQVQDTHRSPVTSHASTSRHTQTVDDSDAVPILSSYPVLAPHSTSDPVERVMYSLSSSDEDLERVRAPQYVDKSTEASRASSISTVKATHPSMDPVMVDPVILYSKKSGTSGTNFTPQIQAPDIVVMMAHNLKIGALSINDDQQDVLKVEFAPSIGNDLEVISVRGRTDQYVPTTRGQLESQHSQHSGLSSDLRPTAAEFVPYTTPPLASPEHSSVIQLEPTADLLGPMKYELDPHGIPWYYYMYQVQFAYDQGYQQGRARFPKKTRQKKQYLAAASSSNAVLPKVAATVSNADTVEKHQHSSAMAPPVEQQAQKYLDSITNVTESSTKETWIGEQHSFSPFAAQLDLIDRQSSYPYPNATVTERPIPGFDLTTIRNVGPNRGSINRNSRRSHHRSDNGLYSYRGRGTAGLRMAETAPFPAPVAPQGRPLHRNVVNAGCGLVDIVYAAERIGGEACQDCEPDHARE